MMENEMSSVQLREKGKSKYMIAFPTEYSGGSTRTQIEAAKEAMRLFYIARNTAAVEKDKEAWIFATRNYGFTSFRLAASPDFQANNLKTSDIIYYYFREAVIHLLEAYEKGNNRMTKEWLHRVRTNLKTTVTELIDFSITETKNWRKRNIEISNILYLPGLESHPYIQAKLSVSLAKEGIKAVVNLNESNEWREALQCLYEMYSYIDLAFSKLSIEFDQLIEKVELTEEFEDMYDSFLAYNCIIQAAQTTFQGDHLKNILLLHEESLEMDLAWQVVDLYRRAITLAQSQPRPSIEAEAKATSRLASFFYRVLRLEPIGYKHAKYVLQLMAGEVGLRYLTEDWYLEAKAVVEESQKKREAYDDDEVAKRREPTLILIQPHLDAIEILLSEYTDPGERFYQFLLHLSKNHPPKKGSPINLDKSKCGDAGTLKETVIKVVALYHPDKNKDYGMEWYVLCEEIVKHLNSLHVHFKESTTFEEN